MRLDKFLAQSGGMTRSQAKDVLKKRQVTVNGQPVTDGERKVDPEADEIRLSGGLLGAETEEYYILHKPAGCVTAASDAKEKTVMELFPETVRRRCRPVGRLDKDTTGLLLVTSDGALSHELTSPKRHVEKTYRVAVEGKLGEEGKQRLQAGIVFSEFTSAPALYRELGYDEEADETEALLTISEGKFHQVKRMFHAVGNDVKRLSRVAVGGLRLPEELPEGAYRKVTREWLLARIYPSKRPLWETKKAVIFDLDGTLVDSMWMWRRIDEEYLGRFGLAVPEGLQRSIEGMSFHETSVYFKERFGLPDSLEQIKADWNRMAFLHYQKDVRLKDGAAEFLAELQKRGIRTGIATSNSRELLETVLEALKLRDGFTSIHTSCEVARGKPAPDIYLHVAQALGCKPEECLVFEDILPGVQAGKAAGMTVCGVADDYSKDMRWRVRQETDDYIFSFRELLR